MRNMTRTMVFLLGIFFCLPVLAEARFDDKNDKNNEALQKEALALNNVRSKEAIRKKLEDLKDDRKHQKQLVQAALPLAQKEEQPFNYSAAHILGMCALQARETTAAITFLKIAIDKANKVKSDEKLIMNRFSLSRAYLADNKPVDAQKVLEKIMSMRLNPDTEDQETANLLANAHLLAENELVRCYMAQGKFDKAEEQLGKLEKDERFSARGKAMVQESKAALLHYKGDVKGAIKIYEQLSEEAESDEEKDSYKELIGNLYGDINEMDKAEKLMGELLKKKPDNAGLNNDLGYMMADHDRKLDEAERMIKKAVDLEPENSSYLDSMAWVLYKKKQYKPAKEWMLKAVAQERGKNTELMEHLGDIHLALGEKAEAKAAYEKAVAAATPNFKDQKRKTEVEKKLKNLGEK